jgi:iron complex outermembrane receptor protein
VSSITLSSAATEGVIVYASELVDLENLEEISVIQGGSEIDTPMVGAVGGSIGMTTSPC